MANKYYDILRAPHQVAFDITNNCNLRCLHCFNSSGENDVISNELSDGEVLHFIEDLASMNLLCVPNGRQAVCNYNQCLIFY